MKYIATNTTMITWDPADSPNCGPILYYTVTATNLTDASDRNTIVVWGPRAEFSNDFNYTISVAAVNRAGSGPSSIIIVRMGKQLIVYFMLIV